MKIGQRYKRRKSEIIEIVKNYEIMTNISFFISWEEI